MTNPFAPQNLTPTWVEANEILKGDAPGHAFHGNQYKEGEGGGVELTPSGHRSLSKIAMEISRDWGKQPKGIFFGAKPYLNSLAQLHDIKDRYGFDDAKSIVNYFLANASGWKGETARAIKAELKAIVKKG